MAQQPENVTYQSNVKPRAEHFYFHDIIGEGAFSTVYIAEEVKIGRFFAIKVCEKKLVFRKKMERFLHREKEALRRCEPSPLVINLAYTFQDELRLFFALEYVVNGDLLGLIKRLTCLPLDVARFYSAQLVLALEFMHSVKVVHRDLKPENILLDERMHIKLCDFGSSRILDFVDPGRGPDSETERTNPSGRRRSFVGTVQYVAPEILTGDCCVLESDLWSLGCIIYHMHVGNYPFTGAHDYDIMGKVTSRDFTVPTSLEPSAQAIINGLICIEPATRLGSENNGGLAKLKEHDYLKSVDWSTILTAEAPVKASFEGQNRIAEIVDEKKPQAGLSMGRVSELATHYLNRDMDGLDVNPVADENAFKKRESTVIDDLILRTDASKTDKLHKDLLEEQRKNDPFHGFVEEKLILMQAILYKRVRRIARKRMFLLTEGPSIYYVDPDKMELKGTIRWTDQLKVAISTVYKKTFTRFYIQVPGRVYDLEDKSGNALKWLQYIKRVHKKYFGLDNEIAYSDLQVIR